MLRLSLIFIGALIFWSSGTPFNRTVSRVSSRVPFEVVDTLSLQDGVGVVELNKHFTNSSSNVKPTNKDNIFPMVTQIVDDTSATVRYYAVYISNNLDSLIIKSSYNNDTSNVRVRCLMR